MAQIPLDPNKRAGELTQPEKDEIGRPLDGASPGPSSYESAPAAGPPESQSGESLLVIAYMLVWIAVLAFVAAAWRRTRGLESRLSTLEQALDKARSVQVPSTKRSASEPP